MLTCFKELYMDAGTCALQNICRLTFGCMRMITNVLWACKFDDNFIFIHPGLVDSVQQFPTYEACITKFFYTWPTASIILPLIHAPYDLHNRINTLWFGEKHRGLTVAAATACLQVFPLRPTHSSTNCPFAWNSEMHYITWWLVYFGCFITFAHVKVHETKFNTSNVWKISWI